MKLKSIKLEESNYNRITEKKEIMENLIGKRLSWSAFLFLLTDLRLIDESNKPLPKSLKKIPLQMRIERAKYFRKQGLSLGKIAKSMSVSAPTIKNYLDNYPYKNP